jgi:Protein of unknown function (DUF1566)
VEEGPNAPYQRPAEGTIKDPSTKLFWSRCALGQELLNPDCVGEPQLMYQDEAVAACDTLVLAGMQWRLPTRSELGSLLVCPDGNPPDPEKGCAEPHYQSNYNPAWFPNEGPDARYWGSDGDGERGVQLSLNSGAVTMVSVEMERARARCVADGTPRKSTAKEEVDATLTNLRVVSAPGVVLWAEPSLASPTVGSLVAGQLVAAGEPGATLLYQGQETHFVKVKGHPVGGWTVDALLVPLPEEGVVEAIDVGWAKVVQVAPDEVARERLVPSEQYRLAGARGAKVNLVLQVFPILRMGSADAWNFRWIEAEEFVCTRRIAELGDAPAAMEGLWSRDAQACEHYEVEKVLPSPFPKAKEVWRLHSVEGGFDGYLVDGRALEGDSRPLRAWNDHYVVEVPGELRVLRRESKELEVLWQRRWDPDDPTAISWKAGDNGELIGSDGSTCRWKRRSYDCVAP